MHDGALMDQRVVLEIHLGDQALAEGRTEHRNMDMCGPPVIDPVAPRIGAGFDAAEAVEAKTAEVATVEAETAEAPAAKATEADGAAASV